MPKEFTTADVTRMDSAYPRIYLGEYHEELVDAPLDWQAAGLQQTASGYGLKLTTRYKINYNGRAYRVYCTCISNVGSYWFTCRGRKIYVN